MNLELFTERLLLRPLTESDLDISLELFLDPEVMAYADGVAKDADIRRNIPVWSRRGGNGCIGIWCVADRESAEKFGTVALLPMPIEEDDTDFSLVVDGEMPGGDVEIGYFLKRDAWGQGYATEAARRIVQFAFEASPLEEVVATFETGNAASRHVLLKTGFKDCGTRRSYGEDGPDFRLTRDAWLLSNS